MHYKLSPLSLNESKWTFRILPIPDGKEGKIVDGLLISLLKCSQKHLSHSFSKLRLDGELPPELKDLNGEVKLFNDIELLKAWRNNLKGIQWTDKQGNLFRGAVDNLLQKGKKLIIWTTKQEVTH